MNGIYHADKNRTAPMLRPRGSAACALFLLVGLLGMTGCAAAPKGAEQGAAAGTTAPKAPTAQTGIEDAQSAWDETKATSIMLDGEKAAIHGGGARAQGGKIVINSAGTYVVSGVLTNGQVVVDAQKDDVVRLVLNGAAITNNKGAAIYAPQCEKMILTLADGTENTVTDGGAYFQYDIPAEEEPDAALFVKDSLTINGTGKLVVNASYNNGIGAKDDLLIVSGDLDVAAANHGLRGRDSVTILGGTLRIAAGNDGIQTNNDEGGGKGAVLMEGGQVEIDAAHDGIQAESALTILGGALQIKTGGGAAAGTPSESCKGLKAKADITIGGGTFALDCADDGIHANGNVAIGGATLSISTGDDGIHADNELAISAGTVAITQSHEGMEGANIRITDGEITVFAEDDGLNVAGGQDIASGKAGEDTFAQAASHAIYIDGGQIEILAKGDGIDANGDINISGGKITVLIDSTPDNKALDYDRALSITGGYIAAGGTGIGKLPTAGLRQSYAQVQAAIKAGSVVELKKGSEALLAFVPGVDVPMLLLSLPELVKAESYDVCVDGVRIAEIVAE